VSLANLYGAGITILRVLPEIHGLDSRIIGHIGADRWKEIKEKQAAEARATLIGKKRENFEIHEILEEFKEVENQDFVVNEILVRKGDPVDEILRQAEKRNCDLIVMGSRGHGIIEEAILGSTTRKGAAPQQKAGAGGAAARQNGIIRKLPNQHRCQLTVTDTELTNMLNAFLATSTENLVKLAA